MKLRSRRALSTASALALAFFLTACEDSDQPPVLSEVDSGPRVFDRPPLTPMPGLTLLDNEPITPGGPMTLVWSEEFDGAALDPDVWLAQVGDGTAEGIPGWGNNELQYYQADNAQLVDGVLVIEARQEAVGGYNYTSARITTQDRVAFRYGRIEARMRLPAGAGTWPAFWMLSQDSPYGAWAASGEIDVMEATSLGVGGKNSVFGTIHYGGEFPDRVFTGAQQEVPGDATAEFHVYALEWDPAEIRWYIDDVLYSMQNNWFSTAAPYPAPFDQAFHILLNVAVGGDLGGTPDPADYPTTMEVDYVRIYSGD
ncbi:MAG: glycoside hydrolase family 16 protein [Woeseiaceae bacterium]|nr:glycoside hydrolase family 16 protein [Woeseiaceae bacterium]